MTARVRGCVRIKKALGRGSRGQARVRAKKLEVLAYQKNLLNPEFLFKLQGGRNGKIKKLEK